MNRRLSARFAASTLVIMAFAIEGGVLYSQSTSKDARAAVPTFRVAANGTAQYTTVQSAIDHVPATGGIVIVAPGTYREQVIINQSHVTLKGTGSDPASTIIVDDTSQGTRGS